MRTLALPRVGPTGPYQTTLVPVNVNVAVAPACVAYVDRVARVARVASPTSRSRCRRSSRSSRE